MSTAKRCASGKGAVRCASGKGMRGCMGMAGYHRILKCAGDEPFLKPYDGGVTQAVVDALELTSEDVFYYRSMCCHIEGTQATEAPSVTFEPIAPFFETCSECFNSSAPCASACCQQYKIGIIEGNDVLYDSDTDLIGTPYSGYPGFPNGYPGLSNLASDEITCADGVPTSYYCTLTEVGGHWFMRYNNPAWNGDGLGTGLDVTFQTLEEVVCPPGIMETLGWIFTPFQTNKAFSIFLHAVQCVTLYYGEYTADLPPDVLFLYGLDQFIIGRSDIDTSSGTTAYYPSFPGYLVKVDDGGGNYHWDSSPTGDSFSFSFETTDHKYVSCGIVYNLDPIQGVWQLIVTLGQSKFTYQRKASGWGPYVYILTCGFSGVTTAPRYLTLGNSYYSLGLGFGWL
jgi:hypothetical protein